jgi:hypothetical protein
MIKPTAPDQAGKRTIVGSRPAKRPEDVFYPDHFANALQSKLRDVMPRLRDHFGWTAEQQAAAAKDLVTAVQRLSGGDRNRAEQQLDLLVHRLITPATEEERERWRVESNRQARLEHGEDADRLMEKIIGSAPPDEARVLNALAHRKSTMPLPS